MLSNKKKNKKKRVFESENNIPRTQKRKTIAKQHFPETRRNVLLITIAEARHRHSFTHPLYVRRGKCCMLFGSRTKADALSVDAVNRM